MSLTVSTAPHGKEPSCRNPWSRCCHCAKAVRPIACHIVGPLSIEDERVSSLKDQVGLPCPLCMSLSSNLLCPRKCHSAQRAFCSAQMGVQQTGRLSVHEFSAVTGKPEEPSVCVCSPASFPWTTLPPGVTIARNHIYRLRRCDTLTVENAHDRPWHAS